MNIYLKQKVDNYNECEGDLNLRDNINCPKCKNKGYIALIINDYEVVKECECMKVRKNIQRLLNSGITKETFDKFTFKNYNVTENWQKVILDKFKQYVADFKNAESNWLFYGGISGAGKTHLCTALFKMLITNGLNGEYVKWVETITELLRLKKSFNKQDQETYNSKIKRFQEVDVLYIDDFLKFSDTKDKDMLLEVLKIIELRKDDLSKITIISSEYEFDEVNDVDMALAGRIFERAKKGQYILSCGKDQNRNYRYKIEG